MGWRFSEEKRGERGERRQRKGEKVCKTVTQYRHYLPFKEMKNSKDRQSSSPSDYIYDSSLSSTIERIHVKAEYSDKTESLPII